MKGFLLVFGALGFVCLSAVLYPWIGVIGYFGFAVGNPTYLWRWSLPQGVDFQKFIVGTTMLGLLLNGFRGNRFKGVPAWATLSLVFYLAWAGITSLSTVHQWDTSFYMTNIWKMILMVCIGIFLIDSPKKVKTLMWVLVLAQGYNAWEINLQYFQTGFCWAAYYGWGNLDNNTYSIMTVPVMGVSLALTFYSEKVWQRCLAGAIFVLQMHEIMLLESRGTMLGALFLAGLGVWYVHKNSWTVTTIVTTFVMGAILAGPPVIQEFASSFKPKEELDSSAESRFKLWKAGVAITMDNPVFGVGPNAAGRVVRYYYEGGLRDPNKVLHNLFFDVSAGSGIPGALFYFSFFILPWWKARQLWKRRKKRLEPWARAALFSTLCGTPGYMTSSMFSSGALIEASYVCAAVGCAAILVLSRIDSQSIFAPGSHFQPKFATDTNPHRS